MKINFLENFSRNYSLCAKKQIRIGKICFTTSKCQIVRHTLLVLTSKERNGATCGGVRLRFYFGRQALNGGQKCLYMLFAGARRGHSGASRAPPGASRQPPGNFPGVSQQLYRA